MQHGALVRRENESTSQAITLSSSSGDSKAVSTVVGRIKRTSALQAPIMLLQGHEGEVFSTKFDPSGQHIASASFDRTILLWNTYGECENYGLIKGHTGAVMEVHWSRDAERLYSCSTDTTVGIWDVSTGQRIKKCKGHSSFVNSCSPSKRGGEIIASGSDDGCVKLWDAREKYETDSLESRWQVTSVCFSEAGDLVFAGGLDNTISVWDLRKKQVAYTLKGHHDTITGLALSPDGSYLLSNSMDNTVKMWDVKPFAPADRCVKTFEGAPHGFEKTLIRPCWNPSGTQIASGSADRTLVIWDVDSRQIKYKLPGHKGCVNAVDWHPKEPIVVSGSTDRTLFLGEVNE
ncbi:hypothetical protein BZG36_03029 [Bifiguratus adelaidae]|uniref:Anaphase-promoting complex subunit 4 WD40 domain-containing protein n=1 Tax=Bifiguratus adelaidae TaxID=1938954 RepID=A0A261XZA4_9FUNG|nr:hypothetical protein BZG36_03029 [Bifiguratus adelaidae]